MRFKKGEVIKVRCALKPNEAVQNYEGTVVLERRDGIVVCNVQGQEVKANNADVYKFEPLPEGAAEKHFLENIEALVDACRKGCQKLLPGNLFDPLVGVAVNKSDDPCVVLMGTIEIRPTILERKSIGRIVAVPAFTIVAYKSLPGTRWEPPDMEEVELDDQMGVLNAAASAIKHLWEIHADNYWSGESEAAAYQEDF